MSLPLGSYEFSHSIEVNVLSIDFIDSAATDAAFGFVRQGSVLTMGTNTGTVYQLEKQE